MAEGIRATVEFPRRAPCPIADVSSATDSVVDDVWTSVSANGSVPTVSEFVVDSAEAVNAPNVRHVLSFEDRHVLRVTHADERSCPCACIGEFGCAVQRYVARSGTLRLVFNAADYDELQAVVGELRDRFPDVDVRRLVQAPRGGTARDEVFVDRGKLTARQLEVLRTAYEMGYFERPRRANATEVAAELDVNPSTFAEHLATAQAKLLADVMEDGP